MNALLIAHIKARLAGQFILFHGITDALAEAEQMNFGRMRDILKQAQIDSEEYYIANSQG